MNLRERLQIRALVNLIINVIEKILRLFDQYGPKKNEIDNSPSPDKPNRPRPLKKIVDSILNKK